DNRRPSPRRLHAQKPHKNGGSPVPGLDRPTLHPTFASPLRDQMMGLIYFAGVDRPGPEPCCSALMPIAQAPARLNVKSPRPRPPAASENQSSPVYTVAIAAPTEIRTASTSRVAICERPATACLRATAIAAHPTE